MKIVSKNLDMICHFNSDGMNPIKFRYSEDNGSEKVIKVDRVISKNMERLCGNNAWIFDCQSIINGSERLYQLKFIISECKWLLWKI